MLKVFIVEDEKLVRQGLVYSVGWEKLNCVVVGEASNGLEALDLLEQIECDLIITDVKMPHLDGIGMIKELKKRGKEYAYIILTAFSSFEYAHSALKLGVTDYLLKPFEDEQLAQALSKTAQRLQEQKRISDTENSSRFSFNAETGSVTKYVELAIKYIRTNYNASDISIKSTAEALALSEGHLSRIFKKETNYTFMEYLTNYRVHIAINLLKEGTLKVYEIANQVGYIDTNYFSTVFKKHIGMTPSKFQESGI